MVAGERRAAREFIAAGNARMEVKTHFARPAVCPLVVTRLMGSRIEASDGGRWCGRPRR